MVTIPPSPGPEIPPCFPARLMLHLTIWFAAFAIIGCIAGIIGYFPGFTHSTSLFIGYNTIGHNAALAWIFSGGVLILNLLIPINRTGRTISLLVPDFNIFFSFSRLIGTIIGNSLSIEENSAKNFARVKQRA